MPINEKREKLMPLADAAAHFDLSYWSLYAWSTKGVDGRRLETVCVGRRNLRTSIEACRRFTAFLSARRERLLRERRARRAATKKAS